MFESLSLQDNEIVCVELTAKNKVFIVLCNVNDIANKKNKKNCLVMLAKQDLLFTKSYLTLSCYYF